MARIRISLPDQFRFSVQIPIRITDLNYGRHVGNDSILSLLHEARVQFLAASGFTEMDFAGTSLIMGDVAIEFKAELFYGDALTAYVEAAEFSRVGFELFYKLTKGEGTLVAVAKTGMICFDYTNRKVAAVPEKARQALSA